MVTRHGLDAPDFVDRLVALTTARTLREAPADLLGVAAPVLGASRLPDLQRAALAAALIDAATTAPPAAARRALSAVSDAARTQGVCREALTAPAAKAFGSHWAPPLRDVDDPDEADAADRGSAALNVIIAWADGAAASAASGWCACSVRSGTPSAASSAGRSSRCTATCSTRASSRARSPARGHPAGWVSILYPLDTCFGLWPYGVYVLSLIHI